MSNLHLNNELYYRKFAGARAGFCQQHKKEILRYAEMLNEFRRTGDESLKSEIEEARISLIRSDISRSEISVSIDVINSIERFFLLAEIFESQKSKRSFFHKKLEAILNL